MAPPMFPAANPEEGAAEPKGRAADARGACLWCGQPLPLLARLRGDKFCSGLHERQHRRQQAELFLERVKKYRRQGGGSKLRSESTKITIRPPKQTGNPQAQPSTSEGLRRSSLPESWRETLLPLAAAGTARLPRTGHKPGKPGSLPRIGVRPSPGACGCAEPSWTEPESRMSLHRPCRAIRMVMGELEHPRVELEQGERYDASRAAMTTPRRPDTWWKTVLWTPPRLPGVALQARTGLFTCALFVRPAALRVSIPPTGTARPVLLKPGAAWQTSGGAAAVWFASAGSGHLQVCAHRLSRDVQRSAPQMKTTERAGASRLGLPEQWKAAHGSVEPSTDFGPSRISPPVVQGELSRLPARLPAWQILPARATASGKDAVWEAGLGPAPQNGWTIGCHFPQTAAPAPAVQAVSPAKPLDLRSARIGHGPAMLRPPIGAPATGDHRWSGSYLLAAAPCPVPAAGSLIGLPGQAASGALRALPKPCSMHQPLASPSRAETGSVPGSGAGWSGWAATHLLAMMPPLRTHARMERFGKRAYAATPLPAPLERISPAVAVLSWTGRPLASSFDVALGSLRLPGFQAALQVLRSGPLDLPPARICGQSPAASAYSRNGGWHEKLEIAPAAPAVRSSAFEWHLGMFWPGSSFLLRPLPPAEDPARRPGLVARGGGEELWKETSGCGREQTAARVPKPSRPCIPWQGGTPPQRSGWPLRLWFSATPIAAGRPLDRVRSGTAGEIAGPVMQFGPVGQSQGQTGWKPEKPGAAAERGPSPVQSTSWEARQPEWWEVFASLPCEFGSRLETAAFQPAFWRRTLAEIFRTSPAAPEPAAFRRERLRLPHLYCRFPAAKAIQTGAGDRKPIGFRAGKEG